MGTCCSNNIDQLTEVKPEALKQLGDCDEDSFRAEVE